MNSKKEMVIINDEIVTHKLSYCVFDKSSYTYKIKYKNKNKEYEYSYHKVKHITNGNKIDLDKYSLFIDNKRINNISEAYEFSYNNNFYYHIILNSNLQLDYTDKTLKKIINNSSILEYLKKVAEVTSINTKSDKKLLVEQMKKVKIDNLNTALANYFGLSNDFNKNNNINCLIFPFGCNSSQYKAVENAINNRLSVIEGPPGTGKTQTILNIIANIMIRNMNCQVVSNNNTAIENIEEKLKHYNLDFFIALLGKNENKNLFVENQKINIPSFEEYENINMEDIIKEIEMNNDIVKNIYKSNQEIAYFTQRKNDLILEYNYFKEYIKSSKNSIPKLNRVNNNKLSSLWNELMHIDKITLLNKIKYIFFYRIGNFDFFKNSLETISNTIQDKLYQYEIKSLERSILLNKTFIEKNKDYEKKFIDLSMIYFKKYLLSKYNKPRNIYTLIDIKKDSNSFINDYPVILSTTYSSRNTFNNDFKFDYIIMDESSQIDVITGTLALSSAKYAVVIGDEKQLPNVISDKVKEETNRIFKEYNLDNGYCYSINSFLSSIKRIIPSVPRIILKEHYRCHPKIINFCNKEFYNNELIIMTEDKNENDVIKIIKTNKGNHSRENTSQRQLDIIKSLLPEINSNDIGIITPYNNQVNLIKQNTENIEISTVHKFQGREKDVIIISTVDDEISDFVANSNIMNVAISRAKKQLIFIITGNNIKNQNINDFIDYTKYINMTVEESKIYSVFDLLYKQYEKDRLNYFNNHLRKSNYDSENLIYNLISNIKDDYKNLNFVFRYSLNKIIKDKSLLTEEEKKYASHHNTHIDFLIYNDLSKKPILAVEVDGYKYHKIGTKQHERDLLKDSILSKCNIPIIRLLTTGSEEAKKIRSKLDEILYK